MFHQCPSPKFFYFIVLVKFFSYLYMQHFPLFIAETSGPASRNFFTLNFSKNPVMSGGRDRILAVVFKWLSRSSSHRFQVKSTYFKTLEQLEIDSYYAPQKTMREHTFGQAHQLVHLSYHNHEGCNIKYKSLRTFNSYS